MEHPLCFGIRHLSPAGAYHLKRLLDEREPELILVEGPSDFTALLADIAREEAKPPIAVMAYTKDSPIRTILYPFAEYSPEYQAVLWAKSHGIPCRFIDLPSGVFLGIQKAEEEKGTSGAAAGLNESAEYHSRDIYRLLDTQCGEGGHEAFWEYTMEHSSTPGEYMEGAAIFGEELRSLTAGSDRDWPETLVREAYMKRQIELAQAEGFSPEKTVVVTGAYHRPGLLSDAPAMTDQEIKKLPSVECSVTLMPYSYYRLSSRSGYGAGNRAPAYYELVWRSFLEQDKELALYSYLTSISSYQREHGFMVSSAEVIEAVELAKSLAALGGHHLPALCDLRDAAVTCMGHGHFSEIALAAASTEIGAVTGSLPQGVSRTSLQDDFYRNLQELRLEKYRSEVAETLSLDLRENRNVKSEAAAFRDLNRSFFLHRLRVLGIGFAKIQAVKQDDATWAEGWTLRWTPEVEIELVEATLKGDTIALAVSFAMGERAREATALSAAAKLLEEAFLCGMPEVVSYITEMLQHLAADSAALTDLAASAESISVVMRFGDIRRLDSAPLIPILEQIFLRSCLLLASACACDDQAAEQVIQSVERLNAVCLHHDFLDEERFIRLMGEISSRDDLNTRISGFCTAILLERGCMPDEELGREVQRRLSKGIPAELGAGWFAGLSKKNRYALIARLSLWSELSGYLDTLDEEEFKRALLFLRRAFSDFTPGEKADVAENLGEIWQVNRDAVAETVTRTLKTEELEMLDSLDDFDFDGI